MTDWRALCVELLDALESNHQIWRIPVSPLVARARAALAADPVAETLGPTRRQLMMLAEDMGMASVSEASEYACAVLARFGAQPAPPAEIAPGPSIEAVGSLIAWLSEQACQAADAGQPTDAGMLTWAAQVIGERVDEDAPAPMAERGAIGPEWQPCVKLPITVHVREQRSGETQVSTREGITPVRPDDLIMRGVQGEEYPIGRELFNKTYRLGTAGHQPAPSAEGEVAELVAALKRESSAYSLLNSYRRWQLKLARTADLLEQRHPTPVPVSERLPGPEDCDAEGRCWWFLPVQQPEILRQSAAWSFRKHIPRKDDYCRWTHWLHANAMLLPAEEVKK